MEIARPPRTTVGWHGPLDLSNVVRRSASDVSATCGSPVRVVTQIAPDLPLLEGDGRQLEALIGALVADARERLGTRGGWIQIETRECVLHEAFLRRCAGAHRLEPGACVCLRVTDGTTRSGATARAALELADASQAPRGARAIARAHGAGLAVERGSDGSTRTTVAFPSSRRLRARRMARAHVAGVGARSVPSVTSPPAERILRP